MKLGIGTVVALTFAFLFGAYCAAKPSVKSLTCPQFSPIMIGISDGKPVCATMNVTADGFQVAHVYGFAPSEDGGIGNIQITLEKSKN